jgi:acetyltransferase-like isoleucine patch superfamily enzyme
MEIKPGKFCVIFPGVTIGEGTRLGNFILIRSDTRIGKGCTIGSYVDIEGEVSIGDHVSLQSSCYITRGVVIEDEVFFGPRVTTMNDKWICHRRKNMAFVRAAPRVLRAARVGGGSILLPGITIGENAFVGNPARVIGRVPEEELL